MSGANNVPIASVYGDTGSVNASYIKDLNQINSDPYVAVKSNSGELNIFQQFQINDNYYDSRYEEMYVTQNSTQTGSSFGLVTIQGNTMGWTRTDQMYLQIPVWINFVWNGQTWSAAAPNTRAAGYNYDVKDVYPPTRLANMNQPDFALFEIFNRIAIYIGNNNQPTGRTQSFFKAGMKNNLREAATDDNYNAMMGHWGLPISNLYGVPNTPNSAMQVFGAAAGATATNVWQNTAQYMNPSMLKGMTGLYSDLESIPRSWMETWMNTLLSSSYSRNGYPTQYGNNFYTQATGTYATAVPNPYGPMLGYNSAQVVLTLPIKFFNNFFRHRQYIPPDFKFKIDIEGYSQITSTPAQNLPIIGVSGNDLGAGLTVNVPQAPLVGLQEFYVKNLCEDGGQSQYLTTITTSAAASSTGNASFTQINNFGFTAGFNNSLIKLIYVNHTLRQPLQQQINEKWIQYPFLYNYETYEVYNIDNSANPTNTQIVRDIAISQQRPTQIRIAITDNVSSNNWKNSIATTSAGVMTVTPIDQTLCATTLGVNFGTTTYTPANTTAALPFTVLDSLSTKRSNNLYPTSTTATSAFPQIQTIQILIGGRTQYYYRNDTLNVYSSGQGGNKAPNAYDTLVMNQNRDNYLDYTDQTSQRLMVNSSYLNPIGGDGSVITFTIAPGAYVNTGNVPSDLGASVVRVLINLSQSLPVGKWVSIWKKMPEQLAVDTNKNATLIMWPAIKSNNGFIMPNVVNTQ